MNTAKSYTYCICATVRCFSSGLFILRSFQSLKLFGWLWYDD
jgi:hypothetical protein